MSDSENDTIPVTPENLAETVAYPDLDGIFAWIRPHSPPAREAFSAVVDASIKEPEKYRHIRQFLHIDDLRVERASSIYTEDGQDQDAEDGQDQHGKAGRGQWPGAFKLCLNTLPRDPAKGWHLGSSYEAADLQLTPSSKTWLSRSRIATRHARLFLHPESSRVVLEARHAVTTTYSKTEVLRGSASRVLGHCELFSINNCSYTFELTNYFATPNFEEELSDFMKTHCRSDWPMNKLLSPTSVGQPLSIGRYFRSPSASARGTFGKVSAGWTKDGAAVAIKVFKSPKGSQVRSHEQLMQYIGQHDNIIQMLDCVYHFDTGVLHAYSVYTPLAIASLGELIGNYHFDSDAKQSLVIDYLKGLSYLNDVKHVMHRDIKPGNLAVTSFNSPKGVILDLDAATSSESSTNHMHGTLSYLAPEIVALKKWEPGQELVPYSRSVDIFAFGCSVFSLYSGRPFTWSHFGPRGVRNEVVTEELLAQFHLRLTPRQGIVQDVERNLMRVLIKEMTDFDVGKRISSTTALIAAQANKGNNDRKGTITLKVPPKRPLPD